MGKKTAFLVLCSVLINYSSNGQDTTLNSSLSHRQKVLLVSSVAGSAMFFGSLGWLEYYRDYEPASFHFGNDFKSFLQVDKTAHLYGSYVVTGLWYEGLKSAGIGKEKALTWSGVLGFIPFIPKEIFEGFTYGDGCSWGDLIADAVGPALFISQELLFDEQVIRYKSSFSRSVYAKQANGFLGKNLFESYFQDLNGHSFWLSFNANRIFPRSGLPGWLNIAAGYSADGMLGAYENQASYGDVQLPVTERYRQFLLAPDIDWSRIKTRSGFLKAVFYGLNFIKIPAPAVEVNSKGQIRSYLLYF